MGETVWSWLHGSLKIVGYGRRMSIFYIPISLSVRLNYLVQIIEALNLSYKDSDALNKIIDESLPGRPRFVRHEIVADGEAFKFFARDVIECIKALWGDTDFVIDLIFEPMCHYADENRTIRIYHAVHIWQMGHTGKGIHSPIDPILIGDLTEGGLQRGPRTSFPPTRHS